MVRFGYVNGLRVMKAHNANDGLEAADAGLESH